MAKKISNAKVVSAQVVPSEVTYVNVWRRLAAYFIDTWICIAAMVVVLAVCSLIYAGVCKYVQCSIESLPILYCLISLCFLVPGVYFWYFEHSASQATPGKRLLGLKVEDFQGQRLTGWGAFNRVFWYQALVLISSFISVITVFFTKNQVTVYDIISKTRVVQSK